MEIESVAQRIPFVMSGHISSETLHLMKYKNEKLGINVEIATKYRNGKPGKSSRICYVNHTGPANFDTLTELLSANPDIWSKAVELYPEPAVNFDDIISTVAQQTGLARNDVDLTIDVFLDVVANAGMGDILKSRMESFTAKGVGEPACP
jgi:hypothetical protein